VGTRWQPTKPRTRIKVVECGAGRWDEQEHKLDFPHPIETFNFRVTGTGHERIERIYRDCCADRRKVAGFNEKQLEHRIAVMVGRCPCRTSGCLQSGAPFARDCPVMGRLSSRICGVVDR
jgi:hypothetical protein